MATLVPIPQSLKYVKFKDAGRQIRVLHLEPGAFDDEIYATLEIVSLDENPVFHALSYHWGDLTQLRQINVDKTPFGVTHNQEQALRHLRQIKVFKIWIDGVCINQSDLLERAKQVENMGDVYRKAHHVHVWLGTANDARSYLKEEEAEFALRLMDGEWAIDDDSILWCVEYPPHDDEPDIAALLAMLKAMSVSLPSEPCLPNLAFQSVDHDQTLPADRLIFTKDWFRCIMLLNFILSREWWTRVWVLQEVMLATSEPTVQIGGYHLELNAIAAVARHLRKYFWESPTHQSCCKEFIAVADKLGISEIHDNSLQSADIGHLLMQGNDSLSIEELYLLSRKRYVTDSRDHVYAMLGMVDRNIARYVPIDYQSTDGETYAIATREMFRQSRSLHALRFASGKRLARDEALSWAIMWASSSTKSENLPCPIFNAHGGTTYEASQKSTSMRLVLVGTIVDRVSWTDGYRTEYHPDRYPSIRDSLKTWSQHARVNLRKSTRRSLDFWRVVFKDSSIHTDLHRKGVAAPRLFGQAGLLEHDDLDYIQEQWQNLIIAGSNKDNVADLWRSAIWEQDFFCTTENYMGSSNSAVCGGDVCCVLKGCYAPAILRPTSIKGEYQFVGLSYIAGWMWGEKVNSQTQWRELILV